jgi:hypothetical protein
MVIGPSDGKRFYKVTDLCKVTKKYIIHRIPTYNRYSYGLGIWYILESELPYLLKKAKDTGIHTLEYSTLPPSIIENINRVLFKTKPILKPIKSNDYYSQLHLTHDAPSFIVDAVWKAIIKHQHPDVGGDSEIFMKYKAAYESVRKK